MIVFGGREDDPSTLDAVTTALALLRLRGRELSRWLKQSHKLDDIRSRSKDIVVTMVAQELLRWGSSSSAAVLLALLRLFFRCRLKENVAVTGCLSLNGKILPVGFVVEKIKAALDYISDKPGAVLVPKQNESEVRKHFGLKPDKVIFVDTIVDVLEHAVEGKRCESLVVVTLGPNLTDEERTRISWQRLRGKSPISPIWIRLGT